MKRRAIEVFISLRCAACAMPLRTCNNGVIDDDDTFDAIDIGFEPCNCDEGRAREEMAALRLLARRGYTRDLIERGLEVFASERPAEVPPPLPEGVTFVPLGEPAAMHNAIADAIGEVQP